MNTSRLLWLVQGQLLRERAVAEGESLFAGQHDNDWAQAHAACLGSRYGHRFRALEIIYNAFEAAGATIRHMERLIDGVRT